MSQDVMGKTSASVWVWWHNMKQFFRPDTQANVFKLPSFLILDFHILGDPGADKGGKGKSKRAEKYICNEEK